MPARPIRPALLALAVAALGLPACSTTWQDEYQGVAEGTYPPSGSVVVREVPWARISGALADIEAQRASSDTHPDEWSEQRLLAEQAALLSGLQISEDPSDILVLGRSVFRSTNHLSPEDGSLAEFARSIGADYAVYSANYLGTKQVARQEPVYRSGLGIRYYHDDGHLHRAYTPWDRTVFVPVVVEADEYAWVVYYLRRK